MRKSRRRLEEALWIVGLHSTAKKIYSLAAGRKKNDLRAVMRSFYGSLLPPKSLVFDIGANVGIFAEIFCSLGAKVIALEPNADCVRHIQLSYPDANIEVIQAVAGAENGLALLNMSDERDDVSSLSQEWISAITAERREYEGLWKRQVTTPMVSLDTLIGHCGKPYFIKIDVEGFESQVLDGLSLQPELLSFEFNRSYMDAALRCLDKPLFSAESVFNFALIDPVRFELKDWVGKDAIKAALTKIERADQYGDVFVRRGSKSIQRASENE
jgi:FkbM family methyltransferase